MKIGIVSDIHSDFNSRIFSDFQMRFINYQKQLSLDAYICAGDIHSHPLQILHFIDRIEQSLGVPFYFVPGNHDIYSKENSWKSYEELLQHPSCIAGHDIKLDDYLLIGDLFWYDYSFCSYFSEEELSKGKHGLKTLQDKQWAKWKMTDKEVHDWFIKKISNKVKNISNPFIFVSHMVPHSSFLKLSTDPSWLYFNAFMGSTSLELFIKEYQPPICIFGHTHFPYDETIEQTRFICSPLGYVGEWVNPFDIEVSLSNRITIIELP